MDSAQTNQTINLQLVESLVQAIRSLSAAEQALLERKLFNDLPEPSIQELMHLADKGGAFAFLHDEPEIYTFEDGEPIQWEANTWAGIRKTPNVMGGDACIRETRIPVWLLVSYRRLGLSEAKLLENYPDLSATDLANAWNYAETYPDEIELAIQQQDEA
jgi:uncharacterized protein (DUF433 family)